MKDRPSGIQKEILQKGDAGKIYCIVELWEH